MLWHRIAWTLSHDRLPSSVIGVHVTPREEKDDLHVITVWNRNFLLEEDIFETEDRLRKAGIHLTMTYKPDIHSAIGIYR